MPRRTSLRDRMNARPPQGREAIYSSGDPEVNGEQPPPPASERWEDAHKRVTFYCSIALLDALETEMGRSNRTKTQVIVDALTDHLHQHAQRRERTRN